MWQYAVANEHLSTTTYLNTTVRSLELGHRTVNFLSQSLLLEGGGWPQVLPFHLWHRICTRLVQHWAYSRIPPVHRSSHQFNNGCSLDCLTRTSYWSRAGARESTDQRLTASCSPLQVIANKGNNRLTSVAYRLSLISFDYCSRAKICTISPSLSGVVSRCVLYPNGSDRSMVARAELYASSLLAGLDASSSHESCTHLCCPPLAGRGPREGAA